MTFGEEQINSLKDKDVSSIRAEIIGCLDDDMESGGEPCALSNADAIASKMKDSLFEEDNGNYTFDDKPMTKDTLIEIKARMRVNFSREKLDFACRIISSLNAQKPETTQKPDAVAKPIKVALSQKKGSNDAEWPKGFSAPEPKNPEIPNKDKPHGNPSTSQKDNVHKDKQQQSPKFKVHSQQNEIGPFERLFGSLGAFVGRGIDKAGQTIFNTLSSKGNRR